jgi:uncharacterized membrane protein
VSAANGLRPGECRITLTNSEWNLLHHVLAIAQEQPAVFGGTIDDGATRVLCATVARIKSKLPPPGAGTY